MVPGRSGSADKPRHPVKDVLKELLAFQETHSAGLNTDDIVDATTMQDTLDTAIAGVRFHSFKLDAIFLGKVFLTSHKANIPFAGKDDKAAFIAKSNAMVDDTAGAEYLTWKSLANSLRRFIDAATAFPWHPAVVFELTIDQIPSAEDQRTERALAALGGEERFWGNKTIALQAGHNLSVAFPPRIYAEIAREQATAAEGSPANCTLE